MTFSASVSVLKPISQKMSSIKFTIFLFTRYIFFALPAFEEYLQNATQKSHTWLTTNDADIAYIST